MIRFAEWMSPKHHEARLAKPPAQMSRGLSVNRRAGTPVHLSSERSGRNTMTALARTAQGVPARLTSVMPARSLGGKLSSSGDPLSFCDPS